MATRRTRKKAAARTPTRGAVVFLRDYTVQARGGPTYKAGEVVRGLSDASVRHFIVRQAAADISGMTDDEVRALYEAHGLAE